MPSSDYRFHGDDVDHADMVEAPRIERESKTRTILVIALVLLAVVGLSGLLILGSQPALSPEDIVGRDDYEGQQPARHIFNLYSLKQEQQQREALKARQAPPDEAVSAADKAIDSEPVEEVSSRVVTAAADAPTETPTVSESYVKSELSREPVAVISVAPQVEKTPETDETPATETAVTVLPVYTITGNQTNMRALPTTDAPVLLTLNKGQTVTVFDETGDWVQVAANDGSGISGYIHQSLMVGLKK